MKISEASALTGLSIMQLKRIDLSGKVPASRDDRGHRIYSQQDVVGISIGSAAGEHPNFLNINISAKIPLPTTSSEIMFLLANALMSVNKEIHKPENKTKIYHR